MNGWAALADVVVGHDRAPATRRHNLAQITVDDIIWAQAHGNPDQPIGLPAVYGAIRLVASTLAQLPLGMYRGGTRVPAPTWLRRTRRYGATLDMNDLVQYLVASMGLAGRAWLLCTRAGDSWRLDPVHPAGVQTFRTTGSVLGLRYTVDGVDVPHVPYTLDRVVDGRRYLLHMPYLITPDHPEGIGPLQAARLALDGYLDAERHAARVFTGGTYSGGRLETDQDISPAVAERYQTRWVENRKTGLIPVLGSGLRYVNDIINPRDAEWIEARQFNQAQIWLMYGIPPDYMGATMTGGSSSLSYSNAQDNDRRFRRNCLSAFSQQIEGTLSLLLPHGRDETGDVTVAFDYTGWETPDAADVPAQ